MADALINVTIYVVQIWFATLKMVNQFVRAQVNLNSFLIMLKTAVFVMRSHVAQTTIVQMVFAVMANAQLRAETKMIVLMENIVQTTDA